MFIEIRFFMTSGNSIDRTQATELLKQLVSIDSVNPSLVPGGAGEREISEFIAEYLREIGLETALTEVSQEGPMLWEC